RRALQLLISETRKKKPRNEDEPTWQLMVRALNDSFQSVRSEAFKSALNLKIGGGGPDTLRFVLQSVHADIRREVLTEVSPCLRIRKRPSISMRHWTDMRMISVLATVSRLSVSPN